MTELPVRTRPEGCLTDFRFDAWLAGELSDVMRSAAEAHVADCARCQARKLELERGREAFLTSAPALARKSAPQRVRASRPSWVRPTLAAIAAAALVLLLVRPNDEASTRIKGHERIGFYVKRGERVTRGGPEERVRPGDQLRFTVTTERARYLAILSLDGAHRASVYFPTTGPAARVEPGSEQALPEAIQLDDTLGRETLFAVFCPTALAVEPLLSELGARSDLRAPSGCSVDRHVIVKEGAEP